MQIRDTCPGLQACPTGPPFFEYAANDKRRAFAHHPPPERRSWEPDEVHRRVPLRASAVRRHRSSSVAAPPDHTSGFGSAPRGIPASIRRGAAWKQSEPDPADPAPARPH
jgi:hypothetical protein